MADDEYMSDPDVMSQALVNALGRVVGEVRMIRAVEPAMRSERAKALRGLAESVERISARLDELSEPGRPVVLGPVPGLPRSGRQNMHTVAHPYQVFIEVLAHRLIGEHRRALTGEMITAYAEVNGLLARTKGGAVPRAAWLACADELERCTDLYTAAWRRFAAGLGDGVGDITPAPTLGPETTEAFQSAVEGIRAALEVFRGEAGRGG